MTLRAKITKATLLLRKLGNKYQTKEEQIAEFTETFTPDREADLDEWIASLQEELAKTPEQREEESRQYLEELMEREGELARQEMGWDHRDEWDDFWADRARDCGAIF